MEVAHTKSQNALEEIQREGEYMYGWNDRWAALCACILNPRLSTPELGFFAVQEFTGDPRKETAQTKINVEKKPLDILGLCRGPGKDRKKNTIN